LFNYKISLKLFPNLAIDYNKTLSLFEKVNCTIY